MLNFKKLINVSAQKSICSLILEKNMYLKYKNLKENYL